VCLTVAKRAEKPKTATTTDEPKISEEGRQVWEKFLKEENAGWKCKNQCLCGLAKATQTCVERVRRSAQENQCRTKSGKKKSKERG